MNKFKENLKSLRQELGLTQKQLAEKVNVSKGMISFWENGIHEPTLSNLIRLAILFHVSIDYLAGLED